MSYQIITDSSCDFPAEMYPELNLFMTPLSVMLDGKPYENINERRLKNLYNALREGSASSTSAANVEGWTRVMEPALHSGKDVIVFAFSSGLSTTYQSAVIAGEDLKEKYPERKIFVVDTRSASLGQGLLVWYACKKRDAGFSIDELYAWAEEAKFRLCHWFTVDDLMYLKRGGRISAATALVGTMLKIKPVLHMDDEGHLINRFKVRGRKAAIEALGDKLGELGLPGENDTVFICHGDCIEDARYLEQYVKEKYGVKEVFIDYTGAVIGSHSGPGTLAFFFLGKHR